MAVLKKRVLLVEDYYENNEQGIESKSWNFIPA